MARVFDGAADLLSRNSAEVTALPVTLACWVRGDSDTGGNEYFISIADASSAFSWVGLNFRWGSDGNVASSFLHNGSGNPKALGTTVLTPGQWYHLAGTFWDAGSQWSCEVFLDGVSEGTDSQSKDSFSAAGWDRMTIGGIQDSSPLWGEGVLALPAFYGARLSDDAIAELAAGVHPYRVQPEDLVEFLDFDEDTTGDVVSPITGTTWTATSAPAYEDAPKFAHAGTVRKVQTAPAGALLDGNAAGNAVAAGELQTSITLSGAESATAAAAGELETAITIEGNAAAVTLAQGELSTTITLSGAESATAVASGELVTEITLEGDAVCSAAASGDLASGPGETFDGNALCAAAAAGELTTGIHFGGDTAAAQLLAQGELTTAIPLSGNAFASAALVAGELETAIVLSGLAPAACLGAGELATRIQLSGLAACQASASGELVDPGGIGPVTLPSIGIVTDNRQVSVTSSRGILVVTQPRS